MGSEHGGKSATIADIPIDAAKLGGYPVRGPPYRTSNAPGPEAPHNPPARDRLTKSKMQISIFDSICVSKTSESVRPRLQSRTEALI